jgi:hypothetical protein
LRAYKCAYVVWDGAGLTGILIEPTADFIAFQQKLIDASRRSVATGSAAASSPRRDYPNINQPTIDCVEHSCQPRAARSSSRT